VRVYYYSPKKLNKRTVSLVFYLILYLKTSDQLRTVNLQIHQGLVLRPCVPETVGANRKVINEKYSHKKKKTNKWKKNQPKSDKPKIRGRKLGSGVNW
jgi:hypothetical protein